MGGKEGGREGGRQGEIEGEREGKKEGGGGDLAGASEEEATDPGNQGHGACAVRDFGLGICERVLHRQSTGPNPLNRRNDFSRPALRLESLNCPFQVALHLHS